MKLYNYNELSSEQIEQICSRESLLTDKVIGIVDGIAERVRTEGDAAVRELTKKFDGAELEKFEASEADFEEAETLVSDELKSAIRTAASNIRKFHDSQITQRSEEKIETTKGVYCWREFKAIERVGLYVPGGTAPLFSTVLMLAIPALIAGCKEIVLCTPPSANGKICPEMLWAAKLLGISGVYKVGGAQAVFALAYGTEQIKKVDKILGPGNQFVTAAKIKVSSFVSIDMPAGPSEVLVIADKNSNKRFVASDLLSQAEHGVDSEVVLVCDDQDKIDEILSETYEQLERLPRKEIAKQAIANSFAVKVPDIETAFSFSNDYAPEHLIVSLDDFAGYLPKIQNAGSVFCGKYSSESFGDYASGTNHTLPTLGFTKSYSGISVADFGKWITFQEVTKEGLDNLGETVEVMADREKLFAHKNAVSVRRNEK